jgi:NADH:ubiquinone oxidoreductase subunit H
MQWLYSVTYFLVYSLVLALFTIFYIWFAARVQAHSQNRHGPNRINKRGEWQFFSDFIKVFLRGENSSINSSKTLNIYLVVVVLLPFLFYTFLLRTFESSGGSSLRLLVLFFMITMISGMEGLLYFSSQGRERYELKKNQVQKFLASSTLFLLIAVCIAHSGGGLIPQLFLVQSPALFFACCISFVLIFYIMDLSPIGFEENHYLHSLKSLLFHFARRAWVVGILSLWVLLFFVGEITGLVSYLIFAAIFFGFMFLLLCIKAAFSRLRADNSLEILSRYLLPMGVLCIVIEVFWLVLIQ